MLRDDLDENILAILNADPTKRELRKVAQLDYYNRTYKGLSYSRSELLRGCPRKYEIMSKFRVFPRLESVTFAYGHAVGAGVQAVLAGRNLDRSILACLFNYDYPLDQIGTYNESMANKSYWHAIQFTSKFYHLYHQGMMPYLDGWEIAKFKDAEGNEVLGVELTFAIELMDGYSYEGHIDLVLYHHVKNKYMVVELKTNGGNVVTEWQYKNSAQGLGYGVVIDTIAGNMAASSSFDVLYIVAKSRTQDLIPMVFTKTPKMKGEWILGLLTEMSTIGLYEEQGYYPRHGGYCNSFFRPCEVNSFCNRPNEELETISNSVQNMDTVVWTSMDKPMFYFSLQQIIETQQRLDHYTQHGEDNIELLLNLRTVG